jgi:arylsulfatase A-like enzyme
LPLPEGFQVDGKSFAALLEGQTKNYRSPLCWHYPLSAPHFLGGGSSGAIRDKNWKLIEFFDDGKTELYDLDNDLGETKDLSRAHPQIASRLQEKLAAWRKQMGAEVAVHEEAIQ